MKSRAYKIHEFMKMASMQVMGMDRRIDYRLVKIRENRDDGLKK